MKDKRLFGFDLLRILALFCVFDSHFVAQYAPETGNSLLLSHLLNGLTGKFGVILFALLAGYFSYVSSKKKELGSYLINRYLFFFSCCLVTDLCFYFFNVNQTKDNSTLGMVVSQVLFLGDYYCETFWFIRVFMIGSFLSFVVGKYRLKIAEVTLLVLVLFYLNQPFIASYVAGCLLYELQDQSFLKNTFVKTSMFLFFAVFFLFYRKESNLMYFEDCLRALALSLLVRQMNFNADEKIKRIFERISSMSMALIIGHVFSFHLCDTLTLTKNMNISVLYLLWLVLTFASGMVFELMIRFVHKQLLYLSGRIEALL